MSKQKNEVVETQQAPAGYWRDADGRLIPDSMVKPIDRTRDQVVKDLIASAKKRAEDLATFKSKAFDEIAAFVSLSLGEYGLVVGGKKGNVTLVSFDGSYKIVRQVAETLVFDERLQAAKALIDECIERWSATSGPEIALLVQDAFQVNKEGHISTSRVLGLKKHAIEDKQWVKAMQAITDSVRTSSSKSYIRFYERDDRGEYKPISLDVATA